MFHGPRSPSEKNYSPAKQRHVVEGGRGGGPAPRRTSQCVATSATAPRRSHPAGPPTCPLLRCVPVARGDTVAERRAAAEGRDGACAGMGLGPSGARAEAGAEAGFARGYRIARRWHGQLGV